MQTLLLSMSQERHDGENHFPNSPLSQVGEKTSAWVLKITAPDLVNAFYGNTIPAATRSDLIQKIQSGELSREEFTGAFLTAKVNDGIAVPTVDDIVSRVDTLNLTPDTLQFDDDHVLTHIYLGAFGRAPDGDGLAYWKAKVDEIGIKATTEALYRGGLENGELDGNVSNTAFVTNFYQSILGREPDAGGLAFWVGKLDAGELDRGFAIHAFVEGTSDGRDAKYVNNKALVAQAFADATVGKVATPTLLKAAEAILASVTEKDGTAFAALEAIANGSAFQNSSPTAKIATVDALDASTDLLFYDNTRDHTTDADEADSTHAGASSAEGTTIDLVGVATVDNLSIIA